MTLMRHDVIGEMTPVRMLIRLLLQKLYDIVLHCELMHFKALEYHPISQQVLHIPQFQCVLIELLLSWECLLYSPY